MCNLYRLRVARWELADRLSAADVWGEDMDKDYVSPGRAGPVVASVEGGGELRGMRWGVPPPAGVRCRSSTCAITRARYRA